MLCTIYRLRDKGKKLSRDDVRATGIVARLVFARHPVYPTMRASMLDPATGQAGSWLDCAVITKVDGGVMVHGYQWQSGSKDTAQVWWCVPQVPNESGTVFLKATPR